MIFDNLKDIVKHTHGLGFIETVKVIGDNGKTILEAIDEKNRSVVFFGEMNSPIAELNDSTVGLARIAVLNGYLNFPHFASDNATIEIQTQNRLGIDVPSEIFFNSNVGHSANYRFMMKDTVNEQVKVPPFKGCMWNVEIEPTSQNLKDLQYFNGVLGGFEPVFTAKVVNGNLELHIGSGTSDRSVVPFTKNVTGSLQHGWSWPLAETLAILKLGETGKCTMSFSDQAALQIKIDSGLGVYTYILPAKTK